MALQKQSEDEESEDEDNGQLLAFLDSDPLWAPNGEIIFTSSRLHDRGQSTYDRETLLKVDRTGKLSSLLVGVDGLSHPVVSPDGTRLAFNAGEGALALVDLARAKVVWGSNFRRLQLSSPTWEVSGKRLVMVGQSAVQDNSPYILYRAEVRPVLGARSLAQRQTLCTLKRPPLLLTLSPDERSLVYAVQQDSSTSREPGWTLYQLLMPKQGTPAPALRTPTPRKIVELPREPDRLSWFPDGKRLIVSYLPLSAEEGFAPQLVQVEKHTLTPFRLPLPRVAARLKLGLPWSVALNPTGTCVAFSAIIPNPQPKSLARGCLFRCNLDGTGFRQITPSTAVGLVPTHYTKTLTSFNLWWEFEKVEDERQQSEE